MLLCDESVMTPLVEVLEQDAAGLAEQEEGLACLKRSLSWPRVECRLASCPEVVQYENLRCLKYMYESWDPARPSNPSARKSGKKKAHKHKLFGPVGFGTTPGLSQGQTQFVPGTNPGCPWDKPGFSPYFTQWKPSLSQGQTQFVPGTSR